MVLQSRVNEAAQANVESDTPSLEKRTSGTDDHVEVVRTVSRVPGNPNYYEKDGLRTYGDNEDHDNETPVRDTPGWWKCILI